MKGSRATAAALLKIADPDPRASGGRWTPLMPHRRASDRSRFGLGSMTSSSPRSGRQAEDEEVEATFCLAHRRTEGALTTAAWPNISVECPKFY
mmetsp:Transcript_61720/g.163494  ORF Transcript_61720/g.163494 Transcript_61720/m.163494 type:complete len:94 (-) Transcript_61720:348-629(-)